MESKTLSPISSTTIHSVPKEYRLSSSDSSSFGLINFEDTSVDKQYQRGWVKWFRSVNRCRTHSPYLFLQRRLTLSTVSDPLLLINWGTKCIYQGLYLNMCIITIFLSEFIDKGGLVFRCSDITFQQMIFYIHIIFVSRKISITKTTNNPLS